MKIRVLLLVFSCFLFSSPGAAQSEKEEKQVIQIFQKKDLDYLKKWMGNIIEYSRLDEKKISRLKIITEYYGLKMTQLGEDPTLTKKQIIERFNQLMENQNKELEAILTKEQLKEFSRFYKNLSWSVNQRLNQL